jgi:hypothetical protein
LMTKKVDKTFHEREIWAVKKLARRAALYYLPLLPGTGVFSVARVARGRT